MVDYQNFTQQPDPVITNIATRIDRYVARVNEEYDKNPATFADDISRQEAAMMNIVRAVAAALAISEHLLRKHKLGIAQSNNDVIERIAKAFFISAELADNLKKMIGFRYDIVHNHQNLLLADLEYLIVHQLHSLSLFSNAQSILTTFKENLTT